MPGEDGYTLLHKVRAWEAEQGGHLPAVALTAYARGEDCTKALDAGFQKHMSKPVSPDDLVEAIASLAGGIKQRGH
jgi:CheY-like chemotaxis protein